jgi:hypothetical protein
MSVITYVTASKRENIVLTTTPTFNSQYLLEFTEIWSYLVIFKEALLIQP